ncbi:hypothetical protein P4O66_000401 [Electrophorus voltai]|uniref:Uncharacterized protein n=1 Tax=Electrophorus voltai TaxID=2609070 RepID=A0AAD9E0A4_9TELE|nr:hypothetical protein P4O66_000401 [Electrophorus voltai]
MVILSVTPSETETETERGSKEGEGGREREKVEGESGGGERVWDICIARHILSGPEVTMTLSLSVANEKDGTYKRHHCPVYKAYNSGITRTAGDQYPHILKGFSLFQRYFYKPLAGTLVGKPPMFLGTFHTGTTGESAPGKYLGGPKCSTRSYLLEYQNGYDGHQFPGSDTVGSYHLYWDYQEDYGEYERSEECQDISLRSDSEVDRLENPVMEVEEALHEDSPSVMDTWSADLESNEPPVPKVPPKARRTRISKLPRVTHKEAVPSSSEDTPSPGAHSPRARVPVRKPQRDKKEASPVPTPETCKTTGALPKACAPKPEKPPPPNSAKGDCPTAELANAKLCDFAPGEGLGEEPVKLICTLSFTRH